MNDNNSASISRISMPPKTGASESANTTLHPQPPPHRPPVVQRYDDDGGPLCVYSLLFVWLCVCVYSPLPCHIKFIIDIGKRLN